jgi:hypothetical protein
LQGGNGSTEYYHLNNTDYSNLTDANAQLGELHTDGSPTLDGANFTGIPDSALDSTFLKNVVEDTTPELGGNLDANANNITELGDVTFKTGAVGGTLRTGTANADKFVLQAYDVNDGVYRTMMEADAGNDPYMQVYTDYFRFEDVVDSTKIAKFSVASITTGTTRTFTFPDTDGTLITNNNPSDLDHDSLSNFVANEHIDHTNVTLTAGDGLSGGGDISANRSFAVDLNELGTETTIASGDFLSMVDITDNGSQKITFSNLEGTIDHGNLAGLSTGADHSYIDQDVTSGSSPTLDGTNFTGIPDGALDTDYVEVAGDTMSGDLLIYDAVNDANPQLRIGSADANEGHIQAVYDSGAQTLDYLEIATDSGGEGDIVLSPSGNVGIGTTSPRAKLDIQGDGKGYPATSGNVQSAGLIQRLHDDSDLVLDIGGNGGGGIWLQPTNQKNLAVNYGLLLNPNGGNVGIGTTGPGARLDVKGGGNDILNLQDSSGNEKVTVLNNGNVGIGLTDPDYALDVSGGLGGRAQSSTPTDPDANAYVIWQTDGTPAGEDDGDLMCKITDSNGTTKTAVLVDFSTL